VEVEQVDGQAYVSDDPSLTPLAYARVQILSGPHKPDATKAHNGFAAVLKIVQHDLQAERHLEPATEALLAANNVGWIIGDDGNGIGLPDNYPGTIRDNVLGAYWRIADATPFLVSGRLETMPRPATFAAGPFWDFMFDHKDPDPVAAIAAMRAINDRMRPDPAARTAAAILVAVRPAGPGWGADQPGEAPTAQLLSYAVQSDAVRLSVDASGPGFIRLAHPLGLGVHVTQDGVDAAPVADVQSLIVLPLHAGVNDFVVSATPSMLRQVCFWTTVSVVAALSMVGIGLSVLSRRRPHAHGLKPGYPA
jgi:hypothetical protein